ncbi:1-acyl-sn-glycerol-3-phosphate acyltransferase [Gammaproteobacteria bacterium]|nr:1-acyl-sn-glycerol-3-phosphate acyltransferase [Gammaproteobacteria bacterium]
MKIIIFFNKLFKFIAHITNTKKIIADIGEFNICADEKQSEKIRLWFAKILKIIGVKTTIKGKIKSGSYLIISNHSSWLDIIILGSTFKTTFLSKIEVSRWPVIGKITTAVDMLFINRGAKDAASHAVNGISKFILNNRNVTIFPEGTSSGGKDLLKFKPRLFASCIDTNSPIQCVIIRYPYKEKNIHPSVPFVRGDSLFLNILKVLFQDNITAEITISDFVYTNNKDRRSIANECYEIIKKDLEKNAN